MEREDSAPRGRPDKRQDTHTYTHRERERREKKRKGRMVARMRSGRTTSARNAGKNVAMRTQRRRVGMRAASAETYSPPKVAPYEVEDKGVMPQKEYEALECPINTYKNKAPFKAKVKSVERIVGPNATGETCHIVIEHQGEVPYWEGQSYGVIPPGTKVNARGKEVPHGVRLYSIASTRYGDDFDGKTASLCVRRATYWDPELGREDPAKKGICSNFLCDAQPGDEIDLTGPSGKVMLLPDDPNAVVIMVATGTGIAPYRGFWRRAFIERPDNYQFTGLQWLFMGVANSDAKLYDDELESILEKYPDQLRVDYALSREQKNSKGGKMYIQDKVEEYSDEVFDLLANGAHIYFCGLKGMMPGITGMLEEVAKSKGLDFAEWLDGLKKAGQWHVEVY